MKFQKNFKRLKIIKEIISKGKNLKILELGVLYGDIYQNVFKISKRKKFNFGRHL